jgi:hypothetical protein
MSDELTATNEERRTHEQRTTSGELTATSSASVERRISDVADVVESRGAWLVLF